MSLTLSVTSAVLLADPGVKFNQDGLPGMSLARKIVGALLTFGLIAAVAGVAISAVVWASRRRGRSGSCALCMGRAGCR
jgi:hypothetical protein